MWGLLQLGLVAVAISFFPNAFAQDLRNVTEPAIPRTTTAPPHRDYLTLGVTRSEALEVCDRVATQTPEVAPAYLRWLVSEVRASGWAEELDRGGEQHR